MHKHTKGPWQTNGARWTVLGGASGHRKGICVMQNTNDVEEADANRSLIKASPDMYAALKAFVVAWEQSHQLEKTDVALRMAKAAIEQIEGNV